MASFEDRQAVCQEMGPATTWEQTGGDLSLQLQVTKSTNDLHELGRDSFLKASR